MNKKLTEIFETAGKSDMLDTYRACNLPKMYPWIEIELEGCDGLDDPDLGIYDRCDNCPIFIENLKED